MTRREGLLCGPFVGSHDRSENTVRVQHSSNLRAGRPYSGRVAWSAGVPPEFQRSFMEPGRPARTLAARGANETR